MLKVQRQLDFGKGFYTTTDFQQAATWAKRTTKIRKSGNSCVSIYDLEDTMMDQLEVLRFTGADREWLSFVAANRRGTHISGDWDLIWGPVANDQTMQTLILYLDGYLSEEETIARLLPQKLKDQIVFKTRMAIESLRWKETVIV